MQTRKHWLAARGIVGLFALLASLAGGELSAQEPISHEPKDGLTCLLVNRNSGRCMSYVEGETALGSKIVQGPMPDAAGSGERWQLIASGKANTYWLRNEKTGLVVQIWATNLQNGPQGNLANKVNGDHQHWTFEPAGDGYMLRAGHSQLVLGVASSALDAGARVIQWNAVPNNKDQIWIVRGADDRSSIFDAVKKSAPASGSFALWVLAGGLIISLLFAVILWLSLRRRARSGEVGRPSPSGDGRPSSSAGPDGEPA
jgi:hypothetical protein